MKIHLIYLNLIGKIECYKGNLQERLCMAVITKKQFDDYFELCKNRIQGKILTPDGLRLICEANNCDPESIGKHFLETYIKFKLEGII